MLILTATNSKSQSVLYTRSFFFFLEFCRPNLEVCVIHKCMLYTNNYGKQFEKIFLTDNKNKIKTICNITDGRCRQSVKVSRD